MDLDDYITITKIKDDKKLEEPEIVDDEVINKEEEINPNEKILNKEAISDIHKKSSEKNNQKKDKLKTKELKRN